MIWLLLIPAALAAILGVLALQSWRDRRADRTLWRELAARQPAAPERFSPEMTAGLPEPARRFFAFAIAEGAPLHIVAEIGMTGELSLGQPGRAQTMPMRARQLLAAPHGFVWRAEASARMLRMAGSDALGPERSWSRFRLFGLIPVARAGGTADHARSAFGRLVAEALFWTPAALLPGPGVDWQAVDADTARVTLRRGDLEQAVDIRIGADGEPLEAVFQRWSDANPDRRWQLQPFGGVLSDYRTFDGIRVPTRVEGGNFFGTPDYFPFFRARVEAVRYPPPANA